ncbi:MAG: hypothetical protein WBZ05_04260 [Desulfobacterales bacterium]
MGTPPNIKVCHKVAGFFVFGAGRKSRIGGHPDFTSEQQGFMRPWSTCAPLAHSKRPESPENQGWGRHRKLKSAKK